MLLLKIFPFFAYIHHFKVFISEIAEKVVIEYNRKMVQIVIQAPNLAQLLDWLFEKLRLLIGHQDH